MNYHNVVSERYLIARRSGQQRGWADRKNIQR
jgi:hypothetical protein